MSVKRKEVPNEKLCEIPSKKCALIMHKRKRSSLKISNGVQEDFNNSIRERQAKRRSLNMQKKNCIFINTSRNDLLFTRTY